MPTLTHNSLHALTIWLVALLIASASAQTWQTVDDFQYVPGQTAVNVGLAVAPSGNLFASGYAFDAAGVGHGLVMASMDAGNTWSAPLDDFTYSLDHMVWYDGGIVADSAGNFYAAGTAYPASGTGPFHWIVRRSTDGGLSWSTVDDFTPGGQSTQPNDITADAAGNVYVAGVADFGNGVRAWTIRKGVGGTSFSTVDSSSSSSLVKPQGIFVHPNAAIFAVGYGSVIVKRVSSLAWIVRRSTDGGATWTTVDTFQYSSSQNSLAFGVGADPLGNLYVVGRGAMVMQGKLQNHWLVRKSNSGGSLWSTVDDYQFYPASISQANRFAADSDGNLYVAGWASPTSGAGAARWIVRKNAGGMGSWQTIDDFQYAVGFSSEPRAIVANSSGNVLIGGSGWSSSEYHWLVRKK